MGFAYHIAKGAICTCNSFCPDERYRQNWRLGLRSFTNSTKYFCCQWLTASETPSGCLKFMQHAEKWRNKSSPCSHILNNLPGRWRHVAASPSCVIFNGLQTPGNGFVTVLLTQALDTYLSQSKSLSAHFFIRDFTPGQDKLTLSYFEEHSASRI